MSTARDAFQRLARLEQILTHTVAVGGDPDADRGRTREKQAQRIRQLTAELQHTVGDNDELDAITMRLLLNDYSSLVESLRAMMRLAETSLLSTAGSLRETRRRFDQQEKLRLKRAARAAPSAQP